MTLPRQILPDSTYLITRECAHRQFFLKPSKLTNAIFGYCLARAAQDTGVVVHAVCAMSNHWHGVVTDRQGRLPEFLERLHRPFAKAQNCALGRSENLWSSGKTSVVRLCSPFDVLEKMAYVIANPTAAGQVHSPHEWPGLISTRAYERQVFAMPDVYFDPDGSLPRSVELVIEPPLHLFPHPRFESLLQERVNALVREARDALAERGERFAGPAAVLRRAYTDVPKTPAPRFNLSPRIAAKDPGVRARALAALKRFVQAYQLAWARWKADFRDTIFPAGTYALRVHAGVRCAPS